MSYITNKKMIHKNKTSSLKTKISSISSNDQWEINPLTGMSRAQEGGLTKLTVNN